MRFAITIFTVLTCLSLTACQNPPITQQSSQSTHKANVVTPEQQRIERLLAEAEIAISRQRLTTPVEDNAYLRYLQVLAMAPNHKEAEAGLKKIVETYLGWAAAAIDSQQYARATNMLNKAQSIEETHPDISTLRQKMATEQQRQTETLQIKQSELTARSPELVNKLEQLGKTSALHNAVAKIFARTDAEARWIYQQMNFATENRIRATIQSGVAPRVQLSFP